MKKATTFLSILIVASLLLGVFGAVGVSAADQVYTATDVTAYAFSLEKTITIRCLFRDGLPDVPYIDPADYLNVIYTDPFTAEHNADGTYTVTNAYGQTMEIDPENDTLRLTNYDDFMDCRINSEGSSISIDYIDTIGYDYSVEPSEVTLDLGAYGIDIAEDDGKVYVPLVVMAAMFSVTYNNALFLDGSVYFVHTMDPEGYQYELDESSRYQELTRSQEMAEFNYNTLCLYMDCFFGKPSNTVIAEDLEEKGLDKTLDEYDEFTQLTKQFLLSTDMIDYYDGLMMLSYYCLDGGHTVFMNAPVAAINYYGDLPLPAAWLEHIVSGEDEQGNLAYDFYEAQYNLMTEGYTIYTKRIELYAQYKEKIVKEWEDTGAYLIIHNDTAVFVFDSFELDTPYNFKEALDTAKEAGVKNFLIDDSCNSGGYVAAFNYICALITNAKYHSNEFSIAKLNPLTGSVSETVYALDLNLDGAFDENDNDVTYDFNFAVLTSRAAFSCGNELPVNAAARGIMIIGEPSGGGSCYVTERYLADGLQHPISDISKSVLPDGSDVDLGVPVDYDLTAVDDEGNVDFSGLYDLDRISELMSGFYKTVKFVDYDGTVIREVKYRTGDNVVVPGAPERKADDQYKYTFAGWDKEISAVTDDVVYTAVYDKTYNFVPGDVNGDGSVDNKDVVTLFRYTSGVNVEINVIALDVNGDGYVDNKDVVILFRFISGDNSVELSDKPYVPADEAVPAAAARRFSNIPVIQ